MLALKTQPLCQDDLTQRKAEVYDPPRWSLRLYHSLRCAPSSREAGGSKPTPFGGTICTSPCDHSVPIIAAVAAPEGLPKDGAVDLQPPNRDRGGLGTPGRAALWEKREVGIMGGHWHRLSAKYHLRKAKRSRRLRGFRQRRFVSLARAHSARFASGLEVPAACSTFPMTEVEMTKLSGGRR